jgi:hypothetical protein
MQQAKQATLEFVTLGRCSERGGRSHDIADELTRHGPGMQSRHLQAPADFASDEPFARLDERADILPYRQPLLAVWGRAG